MPIARGLNGSFMMSAVVEPGPGAAHIEEEEQARRQTTKNRRTPGVLTVSPPRAGDGADGRLDRNFFFSLGGNCVLEAVRP
jgi:hypothetical protein